jgi:hypothetical protein
VEDTIVLIAAIAFTWVFAIAVMLIGWSRISTHARWQAGVDETTHLDGLDEATLAKAA